MPNMLPGSKFVPMAAALLALALLLALTGAPARAAEAPAWSQTPNPDYPLPSHLRGVHIKVGVTPDMIEHLAKVWGVNYITLSMKPDAPGQGPTMADPLRPYKKGLERLENIILPACKENDVRVLFEFAPWGKVMNVAENLKREPSYWEDTPRGAELRRWFPIMWKAMAERLNDNKIIFAYNPLSEPNYSAKGGFGRHVWQDVMLPAAIKAIRGVNKTIWLEVMPGPWGLTKGYKNFEPMDDPYIIYGFHFYVPHNYTHQGIRNRPGGLVYPGMLKMFNGSPKTMWNKEDLEKHMMPAIKFAKANDARLLCGEFGIVRWAPGRVQWLTDVIGLFEKHDIGWSWHNPAGSGVFNLAFEPDDEPHNPEGMANFNDGHITPALRVVLDALEKNEQQKNEQ